MILSSTIDSYQENVLIFASFWKTRSPILAAAKLRGTPSLSYRNNIQITEVNSGQKAQVCDWLNRAQSLIFMPSNPRFNAGKWKVFLNLHSTYEWFGQ